MAERAGRYPLEEVIGAGSFATVHRARDERLDATVVVKVLAENHSLNPEIRERFIAEGRSLRRVDSPYVVAVHDMGETDRQQPYLVLEHADRGTLADRVRSLRARGWTPGDRDVQVVARSLASAIEAVHRARLVHRDLSPGNILLTSATRRLPGEEALPDAGAAVVAADERLVVADLGMCKDLALSSGLTVAGGTAGFRPPEQDVAGVVDTRADLWSMSAVLRWLFGGAPVPARLARVLDRGTATDPQERHADVAEWLADVEAALAPVGPPVRSPGEHGQGVEDGAQPARRLAARRVLLTALVALVIAAAGVWAGTRLSAPTSSAGEVSISIEGPSRVEVGEEAVFTAVTEGIDTWVWTLPTGTHTVGLDSVALTASGPGEARVVLRARAPDGTDLEVDHHLTVEE